MNHGFLQELINLGISLVVTFLVWRFYKNRTFAPDERYSTFGPRFWTGWADSCVMWPIAAMSFAALSLSLPRSLVALVLIVERLAWLLYTVVIHALYGQTVGKITTKVRVVDYRTEGSISWRQAWLREGIPLAISLGILGWQVYQLLTGSIDPKTLTSGNTSGMGGSFWLLEALPVLWFVAEVLSMLTNEKRRALHDLIAGTVVVRTNIEEPIGEPEAA